MLRVNEVPKIKSNKIHIGRVWKKNLIRIFVKQYDNNGLIQIL